MKKGLFLVFVLGALLVATTAFSSPVKIVNTVEICDYQANLKAETVQTLIGCHGGGALATTVECVPGRTVTYHKGTYSGHGIGPELEQGWISIADTNCS